MRGVDRQVVGVAGSIAAGKSTVLKALYDRLNSRSEWAALHLNADLVAHQCYRPDTETYKKIVERFGSKVLNQVDKSVNRQALGKLVFNDAQALHDLEQLTWPAVWEEMQNQIQQWKTDKPHQVVLVDAAILLKAQWHKKCDQVWVLWSSKEVAIDRAVGRGGDAAQTATRWDQQMNSTVGGLTAHPDLKGVEAIEATLTGVSNLVLCTDEKSVEDTVALLEFRLGSRQL